MLGGMVYRLRDLQVAMGVIGVGATSFLTGAGLLAITAAVDHQIAVSLMIAGALIGGLGIALFVVGPPRTRELNQHHADLREFAAQLRERPLPLTAHDLAIDPHSGLLHAALRSHNPELANAEDEYNRLLSVQDEAMKSIEERAQEAAADAGFGPDTGGARFIGLEGTSFARSGKPHFTFGPWSLEIDGNGDVWCGAFSLGRWHESYGSLEEAQNVLERVLHSVDEWPEVLTYRRLLRHTHDAAVRYGELLAVTALGVELSGKCKLCS